MANYLDANPDVAARTSLMAELVGLAPLVRRSKVTAYIALEHMPLPAAPLSVEDYVVWLEVLGFRFELDRRDNGRTGIFTLNPEAETPEGWHGLSVAIMAAFDSRARHDELVAFLIEREEEAL